MKRNTSMMSAALAGLFVLVAAVLFAFSARPTLAPAAAIEEEQSITGCLEVVDGGGYVLQTEQGEEVYVIGIAELAQHIGYRVRLSGRLTGRGEYARITVSRIEMIASNCAL